jgi:AcrR family transcriptional regulator
MRDMKSARSTIMNVATKLFAEKGYSGCSIREICQAAGVTKPVLYYHFQSKEHLYQELMFEMFNETRKNLMMFSSIREPMRDLLVSYVSAELANCKSDPDKIRLIFRMMFSPEGEYPPFNFVEEFKRERKIIAQSIKKSDIGKRCKDPELVSSALMGMMLMEILEFLFTGRRTLTSDKAKKLVDLVLPNSIPNGIEDEE